MSTLIKFSRADLMATTTIPGNDWYSFAITKVEGPVAAKSGTSSNYKVFMDIIDNPQFEGKQIQTIFNTQLIGKMAVLIKACTGKDIEAGAEFEFEELLGKKADGKIGARPWDGNLINEFTDYAAYKSGGSAPSWIE